jgi:hypothetical protein
LYIHQSENVDAPRRARHLVGDAVAFEHVRERVDPEAVALGDAHEHQDLVGAVRVRVHADAAFHDVHERLEPQVAARRHRCAARVAPVVGPRLAVLLRRRERLVVHGLDAGARRREPVGRRAAVLLRDVLAERELHRARRALDQQRKPSSRPQRVLMIALCPPIGFALPCRICAVVTPPDSAW